MHLSITAQLMDMWMHQISATVCKANSTPLLACRNLRLTLLSSTWMALVSLSSTLNDYVDHNT